MEANGGGMEVEWRTWFLGPRILYAVVSSVLTLSGWSLSTSSTVAPLHIVAGCSKPSSNDDDDDNDDDEEVVMVAADGEHSSEGRLVVRAYIYISIYKMYRYIYI